MRLYYIYSLENILPIIFAIVIGIPFAIFGIYIFVSLIKEHKKFFAYFIIYIISFFFAIGGTYATGSTLISVGYEIVTVAVPFHKDKYEQVCGTIDNLNLNNDNYNRETIFSVDGVDFAFSQYDLSDIGLNNNNKLKSSKEVIIKYIVDDNNKRNVIVEIDSVE